MLDPLDIFSGTFSILAVIIATLVGIIIISKYFHYQRKEFLLVGLTSLILVEPWWPSAISICCYFLIGQGIPITLYFFLGNAFIPIGIMSWLLALVNLIFEKRKQLLLALGFIYSIAFEVHFLYSLLTNPLSIGSMRGAVDVEYTNIMKGFLFSVVIYILVTGTVFAMHSIKSTNPEVKLKGQILLIGFISFSVGAFIDALLLLTPLTLIVARGILISCAVELYGGFIMPAWMRKVFIKMGILKE